MYPSAEEAGYTANFAFTLAALFTMAAIRLGKAKMRMPRLPPRSETGSRMGWESFKPEVLRSWSMTLVAKQLGLSPPKPGSMSWVSRTNTEADQTTRICVKDKELPDGAVFVGLGKNDAKFARTMWSSPFRVRQHGSPEECQVKFEQWVASSPEMMKQLPSLRGRTLAGECELGDPCTGNVLAVWADEGPSKGMWRRPVLKRKKVGKVVQLIAAVLTQKTVLAEDIAEFDFRRAIQEVSLRHPQKTLDRVYKKVFLKEVTDNSLSPCINDLVS